MDFGDDLVPGSDAHRRKKRYHRHTPRQIQTLEAYVILLIMHPTPFLPALILALFVILILAAGDRWRGVMASVVRVCVGRMFKECPHPDENQRLHLSRELGLEPRQIKFWFQNRRTQMKVSGAIHGLESLIARGFCFFFYFPSSSP